jgi:hypothetical protein
MRRVLTAMIAVCAACAGAPTPCAPPGGTCDPARLYRARCTGCHRAYEPASRSRTQWHAVLARMARKARLTPEDADLLGGWLDEGAADARGAGSAR